MFQKTTSITVLLLFFTFFLFAQLPPYEKVTIDGNAFYRYEVKPGEGLYSIARTFGTSIDQIKINNPNCRDGIKSGEILHIPVQLTTSTQSMRAKGQALTHTIRPKETLYSVSQAYNVGVERILAANPGLSAATFQIGKTIQIPHTKTDNTALQQLTQTETKQLQHTVKRGETLYGIAQRYNVTVDDIRKYNAVLKSIDIAPNLILLIPIVAKKTSQYVASGVNLQREQSVHPSKEKVMKIGLLMPFLEKEDYKNIRLQEYYEGFLLAVEKMKKRGANIELYVFDIGKGDDTRKLQSLLGTMEMQSLQLIVGGVSEEQINILSDFAQMRQIKYVIPFSSKNANVFENSQTFQINSPQSYIDAKILNAIINTYKNSNVIFLDVANEKFDKSDFVTTLKNELRKRSIRYNTTDLNNNLLVSLAPLISDSKKNVIIPSAAGKETLRKVIDALLHIQEEQPSVQLHLFGYPEWQTFDNKITKNYSKLNTVIYSSFYVDENDVNVADFNRAFKKWYKRDLLPLYPKFGMLGYDTGLYFMTALNRYGTSFDSHIAEIRVNTVQFPFHFVRVNDWGGFINTGTYFVKYTRNGLISRKEIHE